MIIVLFYKNCISVTHCINKLFF